MINQVSIPQSLLLPTPTPTALCNFVFPELSENFVQSLESFAQWIKSRAIICSTNDQVNQVNEIMNNRMPGNEYVQVSTNYQLFDGSSNAPAIQDHHLNQFTPQGVPTHVLKVKIGTPVMLLRNIAPTTGHAGIKYVVKS